MCLIKYIKTYHNSILCIDNNKSIAHVKDKVIEQNTLLIAVSDRTKFALIMPKINVDYFSNACLFNNNKDICLFSLSDNQPIRPAHIVLCKDIDANNVNLINILSQTFLSARPLDEKNSYGKMQQLKTKPLRWESFTLIDADQPPSVNIEVALQWIANNFNTPVSHATAIELFQLENMPVASLLISLLTSLISFYELEKVGQMLKESPHITDRLKRLFPHDIWISQALPELSRRYETQIPVVGGQQRKFVINADLDILASTSNKRYSISEGQLLNAYARKGVMPTKRACVVTSIRNEGIYLLEWIAYYKAIGFEEIFIYSNNNDDGSDELLQCLADSGHIVWINSIISSNISGQQKAFAHAITFNYDILDYEWALFADLDEFFVFNGDLFKNIHDFLDWQNLRQTDAIGVNWALVGSNGLFEWTEEPVLHRFRYRLSAIPAQVKSFIKPQQAMAMHCHYPIPIERSELIYRESNSEIHSSVKRKIQQDVHYHVAYSDFPSFDYAFMLHYVHKSCEEFLWKISRNRGRHAPSSDISFSSVDEKFFRIFLSRFNVKQIDNFSDINKICPNLIEKMTDLMTDKSISRAYANVKVLFQERLSSVIVEFNNIQESTLGPSGNEFFAFFQSYQSMKQKSLAII